ncbi:5'-nucleotidase/UDP-sugar diphosphatase [Pasteurella langaaensis DSM 22999]|uniref:5'-nucleotidase/UDP-sugar diphosphatase n=1 Tax=Alitibacter langaaensis DSM 22999 TaxID=1122935 RepID=A0A2U0TGX2_9PAST|nr:bifunctional UDP-sugar hydrolase/5'-nucleotidase UshA [Pasteurella langaaensis]PVX42784.1 5'-nucleotidase/UDP-sugar diphosphatase [Pasteurella langaaensis DSM 22999]
MKTQLKLTALSLALFATAANAYEQDKTYHFTVLHTNDLHGHFFANDKGEYGFAAQKTLIDRIKKEVESQGGSVILLNAGDVNTGTPESDTQNARPDIEGMNEIGYEAMALGNHEFDNPLQLLDMQEKWAKFPFLAANVYNAKTGKPLVKPYVILDKQGLKVAVVGLTTEDTAKLGNPEYMGLVRFDNPIDTARKLLAKLQETEKPDVKIALTHMGYYYDGKFGSNAPGDVTMARQLDKQAFDMIVGGHSHDTVCVDEKGVWIKDYKPTQPCRPDFQNGTWIMQTGEWGKFVGRADFEFKNGKTRLVNYQLIPVNLKEKVKTADGKTEYRYYAEEIPQDQTLLNKLQHYKNEGDKLLNVKVGETHGKLEGDRQVVRFKQTNLGRLIAETQRAKANADVGIINSGVVRTSIENGVVTYRDVLTVLPFGNAVSYVDLNGKELQDYLNVVALKETDSGGYPQFSAGISMTIDFKNKTVSDIKIHGEALSADKKYRISVPNYSASGGDGYPVIKNNPTYVDTGFIDADVLKEFFEKNSHVDASKFEPKGEIVYK